MTTVRSASRSPVRGSSSSASSATHVGHLVAALAAADVDDDVGVAPLGDLLQQHGLAGAEAAGDGGAAAPGDREEQVEHPLPGVQRAAASSSRSRHGRGRRTGHAVRERHVARRRPSRPRLAGVRSAPGGDALDPTADAGRHQDPQRHRAGVARRCPARRPAPTRSPSADGGREGPAGGSPRGRIAVRAPARSPAVDQRPQQAVEDAAEQARAQRRRQRPAAGDAPGARAPGRRCPRRPAR